MGPLVHAFFDNPTNTVSYVVQDPAGTSCAIVDSVLDYDQAASRTDTTSADGIIEWIAERKLRVEWILETHVHADHLSAAPYSARAAWWPYRDWPEHYNGAGHLWESV